MVKLQDCRNGTLQSVTKGSNGFKENDNDLIKLYGPNKTVTTWRYPKGLTKCSFRNCGKSFSTHKQVISHYQKNHTKNAAFCATCNKPFYAKSPSDRNFHNARSHPKAKCSPKPNQLIVSSVGLNKTVQNTAQNKTVQNKTKSSYQYKKQRPCHVCGKQTSNFQRHLKETHGTERILCPLIGCNYEGKRLERVRLHWERTHPTMHFPEIRSESQFTYRTNNASGNWDQENNVRVFLIYF